MRRILSILSPKKLLTGFALGLIAAFLIAPVTYAADYYNRNVYGSDIYGSSTDRPASSSSSSSSASSQSTQVEPTVIKTDSGLEVAINLTDGQAIPSTGYYITITPLNGQGKSFDKAEIYLDGELAYSGAPDSTGTLKWLWDTSKNPASKVKIIVFGPGSGTTTHEFNVTVTPVEPFTTTAQETATPTATPATDSGWPLWLVLTLIVIGLLLAGLLLWAVVRRRRHRNDLPPPPTTPFAPLQ